MEYLVELAIGMFTAFVGAAAGGWAGYKLGLKQSSEIRREVATNELINEFFSADMVRERLLAYNSISQINADSIAKKYGTTNLRYLFKNLRESESTEQSISVRRVLDFLNKAGALADIDAVDSTVMRRVLGSYFDEWLDGYFAPYLSEGEEGSEWDGLLSNLKHLR